MGEVIKSSTFSSGANDKLKWWVKTDDCSYEKVEMDNIASVYCLKN